MSNQLCILIQSEYPLSTPNYQEWDYEIQEDAKTVGDVLSDYDIVSIRIPIAAKPKIITDLVQQALDAITKVYENCHIVLNTHGAPGASDLPHDAVKKVLIGVSHRFIVVSQISALQCDGMSELSPEDQLSAEPMRFSYPNAPGKGPRLNGLQEILKRTPTNIPQQFNIYGCAKPYDPVHDKLLVISILNGNCAGPLGVYTSTPRQHTDYLKMLRQSIDVVRATNPDDRAGPAYDTAANILGEALNKMKKDVRVCLRENTDIDGKAGPLLQRLQQCAQTLGLILNDKNLDAILKIWLKENKLSTNARLSVFEEYCWILQEQLGLPHAQASAALGKVGLFAERCEPNPHGEGSQPESDIGPITP